MWDCRGKIKLPVEVYSNNKKMQEDTIEAIKQEIDRSGYSPRAYLFEVKNIDQNTFIIEVEPIKSIFRRWLGSTIWVENHGSHLAKDLADYLSELHPEKSINIKVISMVELLIIRVEVDDTLPWIIDPKEQELWHQYVNRRFGIDYSPADKMDWKELYHTLLEIGPNVSEIGIKEAVALDSPGLLRLALRKPGEDPNSVLLSSSNWDNPKLVEALLDDSRLLYHILLNAHVVAVTFGDKKMNARLLRRRLQKYEENDIYRAILTGNRETFLEFPPKHGNDAKLVYMTAAIAEDPWFIEMLDPYILDGEDYFIQHRLLPLAIFEDNVEIVDWLLKRPEAELNLVYSNPLTTAIHRDSVEVVKMLLSRSDIDPIGPNGTFYERILNEPGNRATELYFEDPRVVNYIN